MEQAQVEFPDPGDGTRAGLWLEKISHAGLVGTTSSVPDIEFTPVQKANRVDAIGDHSLAMNWMRIARIRTESGGTISVTYSDTDCAADQPKPNPATNTRRCYPVIWEPEGHSTPVTDWFHKYVVTTIYEADNTGGAPPQGSPRVVYSYNYFDAAWHYNDDDGIIDKKSKTWSDWRGYGRVEVTVGDPGEQSATETRYFQGMHGDRASTTAGDRRTVTIDGITDHDYYAGMVREEKNLNGPGGQVVSRVTNEPWASGATATRTINGDTVTARFTRIATVRSYTSLDAGRGERATGTTTTYDAYGMATAVDDHGHDGVDGDEQCTKISYTPRNDNIWLMDRPHRTQTYAVKCADTGGALTESQVIGETRTSYDGNSFGTAPTRGLTTRTEEMATWNGGTPTFTTTGQAGYDAHGRITSSRDAMNSETRTAYTPVTGGPVTSIKITNAMLHETTTTVSPAWGSVTSSVDANGKRTDLAFDGLGRITRVWLPDRDKATDPASVAMDYRIQNTAASYVATSRLNAASGYVTSYALYDGLLRPRQTQASSPSGGRLLTEAFYDSAGRTKTAFGAYHTTGSAGGTLVTATERALVPTQTRTDYDGAGRVTASVFQPYDVERWRTRTYYAGDRTDITPPNGGTATSTVTDARDRVVQLRQYHGAAPTPTVAGSWDTTTYAYNRKGQTASITDAAGNEWKYTYDLRGRQITTEDPDRGATTLSYDNAGRVTTTTDARQKKIAYLYDPLNRKRAAYDNQVGGTMRAQWIYDTLAKGYLTQSTRFLPGGVNYQVKVTGYNDTYQPEGTQYIIPTSETGLGGTYNYTNTWNPDGSPASLVLPSTRSDLGAETLLYGYSNLGLPTTLRTLTGSTTTSYVDETTYNALGQLDEYDLHTGSGGHVWQRFTRELETGRLTGLRTVRDSVAPHTLADTRYTYDPAGNITKIADTAPDPVDDTQCFTYDHLRRLTHAWTPASSDCTATRNAANLGGPAPYWHSWTFDTVGNRTKQNVHTTTGTSTTDYHYPAAGSPRPHALTSTTGAKTGTYTYNATGDTLTRPASSGTQTLTWDEEGLLETTTDTTGQTRYIYDADGNRIIRRDPTGATLYLPGQEIRYTNATGANTCTRYYTHASRTIASRTTSGLTWLNEDHQGTQNIAIDAVTQVATTRRQTPYGEPRSTQPTWPNLKGFVNGDTEPTGLTRLGARHYDPATGRFISVDPIQDMAQPQQWHGYSYANNNPTTFSDPSGLYATGDNEGHVRDYSPKRGVHKIVDHTPKTRNTTAPRPPIVIVNTPNYKVTIEDDGKVYVSTYPVPPGISGTKVAKLLGEWCDASGSQCDQHFYCGTILTCDELSSDQAAVMALYSICSTGECSHSVRIAISDDERLINLLAEGLFDSGGGAAPGARGSMAGAGGRTGYKAKLSGCQGSNSFIPGTHVLMADGTTKPIEDIKVGDLVLATDPDPETGKTNERLVTHVINSEGLKELVAITVAADPNSGHAEEIVATGSHPFWLEKLRRWFDAKDLRVGDLFRTSSGTYIQVAAVRMWSQHQTVHNLTVADTHTYYVLAGKTPVLVHNTGGCIPALRSWQSERFQFGNQQFLLDKRGMEHILTRHHPAHWDGSVKAQQSFFDRSMSVEDVQGAIGSVMRQNRDALVQRGGRGMYQIQGNVNGVDYVLGVNNGRVGQFYQLPGK
ncbi:polymorphic toxin-type HINT domain-containing protein [Micromonospora craniellae]|uniref:polymorphic toxin-type HINT domain-containing protein n=1 Tax=Micromonospora craniellae TaxID=2294034 RepID=UPI001CC3F669